MKGWLYILQCADNSYYVGSTNNLDLRLAEHAAGEGSHYTRKRLPCELIFAQEFPSEHDAFLRERQVKGWSRVKKEALIRGDFDALVVLAKSKASRSQQVTEEESASHRPVDVILRRAQDDSRERQEG